VIGNYVPDLLALLVRPKKVLAKRNFGRNKDFAYALTFLSLSLLFANWLALGVWRSSSFTLLLYGVIVGITCTLLLSLPLYMAWRLSARPA
jgi:fatty acid desaturase